MFLATLLLTQIINRPPTIAHVAGFVVGVTTKESYEKQHGKGHAFTGGHPRGGREWHLVNPSATISIDPFDYGPDGAVVDSVSIDFEADDRTLPQLKLRGRDLGMLGLLKGG